MNSNLKLKTLTRLVNSNTEIANQAILDEFSKIANLLTNDTQYEVLHEQLEFLEIISVKAVNESIELIAKFISSIQTRQIQNASPNDIFGNEITKYQNANTLIVQAVRVLSQLRYLNTSAVFNLLFHLAMHESIDISGAAKEALKVMVKYDIDVVHGNETHSGIGIAPQELVLQALEGYTNEDLLISVSTISVILDELLSTSMERSSWTSNSLTLSKATVPAVPEIANIRRRVIVLLKKIYHSLDALNDKLKILSLINSAANTHMVARNEELAKIVESDTKEVLQFYLSLIDTEKFQTLQKIEHNSYWIFYHALSTGVEDLALTIEKKISLNSEYTIYKTLIGFEGIHDSWIKIKQNKDSPELTDEKRKEDAIKWAKSINVENFPVWKNRILEYCKVRSEDLATFPIFYEFLEQFGESNPKLALKMVKVSHAEIQYFLIPLLHSLWSSPNKRSIQTLMHSWVSSGLYLYQCAKQFHFCNNFDYELIDKIILKAFESENVSVLVVVSSLAVTNYKTKRENEKASSLNRIFIPSLEALTILKSASWIFDFWYRPETTHFMSDLNEKTLSLVLKNLLFLEEINFHAEEVLYQIAQTYPVKVIDYLAERLRVEKEKNSEEKGHYEAIPFQLYKLNQPLSKFPAQVISTAYELYKTNNYLFQYKGAKLIRIIFPVIEQDVENELIKYVKDNKKFNLSFITTIISNYEGQVFIHNLIKEVIKSSPINSDIWNNLAVALESTGVVTGEFGFSDAYEKKKYDMESWLDDPDTKINEFAKWFINILDIRIASEKARAQEQIALRKHQYGED